MKFVPINELRGFCNTSRPLSLLILCTDLILIGTYAATILFLDIILLTGFNLCNPWSKSARYSLQDGHLFRAIGPSFHRTFSWLSWWEIAVKFFHISQQTIWDDDVDFSCLDGFAGRFPTDIQLSRWYLHNVSSWWSIRTFIRR